MIISERNFRIVVFLTMLPVVLWPVMITHVDHFDTALAARYPLVSEHGYPKFFCQKLRPLTVLDIYTLIIIHCPSFCQ